MAVSFVFAQRKKRKPARVTDEKDDASDFLNEA
jgi:hypothetical protein